MGSYARFSLESTEASVPVKVPSRIHRVEILEAEPGSGISPFDSLWEAGWEEGASPGGRLRSWRPEPKEELLGAVLRAGRPQADRLPLSFQTQAEGDAPARRPLHGAEEDPRPEARPGREPCGTPGGPRGAAPARLAGGRAGRCPDRCWEGLGGAGLPSAPGGLGLGPDGEDWEPGAAACASWSPAR